jgi:hypothetical protein
MFLENLIRGAICESCQSNLGMYMDLTKDYFIYVMKGTRAFTQDALQIGIEPTRKTIPGFIDSI